jgi:hypothetical protein
MRDYNETISLDNDERIASGSVKVVDYELLVGEEASGSIEVLDYEELVGVKASGGITITAFASLAGKTVTVGDDVLTEAVDFTAGTSNDATAESLKDAIHALAGYTATRSGAVITVVNATAGRAGNAKAMSSNAAAGISFSENSRLMGGKDEAVIKVGANTLTQGTGFTAGTSNAVTAESIKDAIHALTGITATRTDETINIEMSAVGVAGNIAISATWDNMSVSALELSGATLTGGRDEGTITVGTDVLTQGTDFTSATDEDTTAESIKDAIHALSDISATRTDDTVDVVADSAGLAGNLAISSNSAGVEVSGMSGGADYFYTGGTFDYDTVDNSSITITAEVTAITHDTPSTGRVNVVVEVSDNKKDWEAVYQFDSFGAVGSQTATITEIKRFARFRHSVSDATADVSIRAITSQFGGDVDKMSTEVKGDYTILDDGTGSADVPVALSVDSANFDYLDVQAPLANTGVVTLGDIELVQGASKRYVAGNVKDIVITDGTIGDKVVWTGMKR